METCSELLAIYSATSDNVLSRIITGDEPCGFTTGIQTPNRSRRSGNTSTLLHPGSFALNVGWKVMATIFWYYKGVLLVDYLPQNTTMTGPYYGEVLTNLRQAVKERRRGMLTRGPLLLHDDAPGARVSSCTGRIVKDIGFQQLFHPPYSPDLVPSNFYLFRHLKLHLRGTRFSMTTSSNRPQSRISTTCLRNSI